MLGSRHRLATALVLAVAAAVAVAVAAAGSAVAATMDDGPQAGARYLPRAHCGELRGMTIPASAIALQTGRAVVADATLVEDTSPGATANYCLVDGEIAAVGPGAQPIKFQAAMPGRWNGKTLHLGGGGFDGQVVSPVRSGAVASLIAPPSMLARGYVVFGSDSGHAGANWLDASFALNDEQFRNFAGEQLKKTHDAVEYLVKAFYGIAPAHHYFIGGSEGGREALTVIQHYPQDYDGVVSIFPTLATTAVLLKMQVISRAMRLHGAAGRFGKDKAEVLRRAELAACDQLDGLKDSIISNQRDCNIEFIEMRCPDGRDTGPNCFSDAQLSTLRIMHSPTPLPYALSGGATRLPGYTIGADFTSVLGDSASSAADQDLYGQFADAFVRYVLLRDPGADATAFDPLKPGKVRARLLQVSALLDRTTVDIDAFIANGGKWILVQGQADAAVPAAVAIEYYQSLVAKYGQTKTDGFLRFYLIPGYAHGDGISFNASDAPLLDALEAWVERRVYPSTPRVVDANATARGRSRPLCVYPAWPKYAGAGDPDLAASFSCAVHR